MVIRDTSFLTRQRLKCSGMAMAGNCRWIQLLKTMTVDDYPGIRICKERSH